MILWLQCDFIAVSLLYMDPPLTHLRVIVSQLHKLTVSHFFLLIHGVTAEIQRRVSVFHTSTPIQELDPIEDFDDF